MAPLSPQNNNTAFEISKSSCVRSLLFLLPRVTLKKFSDMTPGYVVFRVPFVVHRLAKHSEFHRRYRRPQLRGFTRLPAGTPIRCGQLRQTAARLPAVLQSRRPPSIFMPDGQCVTAERVTKQRRPDSQDVLLLAEMASSASTAMHGTPVRR